MADTGWFQSYLEKQGVNPDPPKKKPRYGPLSALSFVNERMRSLPRRLGEDVKQMATQAIQDPRAFTMTMVGTGDLGPAGKGANKLLSRLLEPGGATLTKAGEHFKGSAFMVADPALTITAKTSAEVAAFLKRADVKAAIKAGGHYGKWTDPKTGISEINISHPFESKPDALAVARQRKEKAIGHISHGEYQGDIPTTPPKVGTAALRFWVPGEKEPRQFTGSAHPFARLDAEGQLGDLLDDNFEPRFREESGFLADDGKTWMTREDALESAKYHKQLGGSPRDLENVKRSGQLKSETLRHPEPPAEPEKIVAASSRLKYGSKPIGGGKGRFEGITHADAYESYLESPDAQFKKKHGLKVTMDDLEEGFLTDKDRWVSRDEALEIAKARDQWTGMNRMKLEPSGKPGLMSEALKQPVVARSLEAPPKLPPAPKLPEQVPPRYYVGARTTKSDMDEARELMYKTFRAKGPYGKLAAEGEKIPGAPEWYDTRDITRQGEEAAPGSGGGQVNEIMNMMAGTTARGEPKGNLKRGILWSVLNRRNLLTPEPLRNNVLFPVPPKFGHFAQRKLHQKGVADVVEHGGLNPIINPKPASFGGAGPSSVGNLGMNWAPMTLDDVMSRMAVAREPRLAKFFSGNEGSGMAPKKQFYGPLTAGFRDAAHEAFKQGRIPLPDAGLDPTAAYQAMGWMAGNKSTGSLADIFGMLRDESAKQWGVSPAEANKLLFKEQRPFLLPLDYLLGGR